MRYDIRRRHLTLLQGDIARTPADALVNASNEGLVPGAGVSGALHSAGGPTIADEGREIGHCDTGRAVATGAGNLPARHVIHAVAPRWRGGNHGEADLLRSTYLSSLELADQLGDKTIAFPSLGTGIFGYPIAQAATIALTAVMQYFEGDTQIERATFVLFSANDLESYRSALQQLTGK